MPEYIPLEKNDLIGLILQEKKPPKPEEQGTNEIAYMLNKRRWAMFNENVVINYLNPQLFCN